MVAVSAPVTPIHARIGPSSDAANTSDMPRSVSATRGPQRVRFLRGARYGSSSVIAPMRPAAPPSPVGLGEGVGGGGGVGSGVGVGVGDGVGVGVGGGVGAAVGAAVGALVGATVGRGVGTGVAGIALAGGGPPPMVGRGVGAPATGRGVAVGVGEAEAEELGDADVLAVAAAVSDGPVAAPRTPSASRGVGEADGSTTEADSRGRRALAPTMTPAPITSITAIAAAAERAMRSGAPASGESGAARRGGGGARPGSIARSASNEAASPRHT